jgi:hypothetical protein
MEAVGNGNEFCGTLYVGFLAIIRNAAPRQIGEQLAYNIHAWKRN